MYGSFSQRIDIVLVANISNFNIATSCLKVCYYSPLCLRVKHFILSLKHS